MDMRIRPNSWARPASLATPAGGQVGAGQGAAAGFRLPASQAGAASATAQAGPSAAAGLVGSVASPRDQLARRRGRALLGGLSSLQRELLGGAADSAAMQRLAGLLEGEDGEDPELAQAMQDVALRARIELLRRGISRGGEPDTSG